MAKYSFTKEEFEQIAQLLKNRAFENKNKQKNTRAKIRKLGFYISDYHMNFSETEFRNLEKTGEIDIIGHLNYTQSKSDPNLKKQTNKVVPEKLDLMKKSLEPIIDNDTEYLVLGTMPGEKSLEEKQYYNNPSNQFWKIISAIYNDGKDFKDYSEKTNIILKNKIGLWDVLKKCERKGSLDSAIKNEVLNDFDDLFEKYPNIKVLIFNGNSSFDYFPYKAVQKKMMILPSTSSANTHKNLNEKIEEWKNKLKK